MLCVAFARDDHRQAMLYRRMECILAGWTNAVPLNISMLFVAIWLCKISHSYEVIGKQSNFSWISIGHTRHSMHVDNHSSNEISLLQTQTDRELMENFHAWHMIRLPYANDTFGYCMVFWCLMNQSKFDIMKRIVTRCFPLSDHWPLLDLHKWNFLFTQINEAWSERSTSWMSRNHPLVLFIEFLHSCVSIYFLQVVVMMMMMMMVVARREEE